MLIKKGPMGCVGLRQLWAGIPPKVDWGASMNLLSPSPSSLTLLALGTWFRWFSDARPPLVRHLRIPLQILLLALAPYALSLPSLIVRAFLDFVNLRSTAIQ